MGWRENEKQSIGVIQVELNLMLLAAPLAKLGRLEEAKAAAARVLELQPAFRYGQQFAGVDCAPALAAALAEALRTIGLPR